MVEFRNVANFEYLMPCGWPRVGVCSYKGKKKVCSNYLLENSCNPGKQRRSSDSEKRNSNRSGGMSNFVLLTFDRCRPSCEWHRCENASDKDTFRPMKPSDLVKFLWHWLRWVLCRDMPMWIWCKFHLPRESELMFCPPTGSHICSILGCMGQSMFPDKLCQVLYLNVGGNTKWLEKLCWYEWADQDLGAASFRVTKGSEQQRQRTLV